METEILHVLHYFLQFKYPPTVDEIHLFLPKTHSRSRVVSCLQELVSRKKALMKNGKVGARYTVQGYSTILKNYPVLASYSRNKRNKVKLYIRLLSAFSQIKFVGVSGSLAMNSASLNDDIDLFIITASDRLWTGRLICILLADVLNMKRQRGVRTAKDKVCLNLFFDESHLRVPEKKQTEYGAHEVLQVKPLINKGQTYERFLEANRWVVDLFPNSFDMVRHSKKRQNNGVGRVPLLSEIGDLFELVVRLIQEAIIERHRTNELVTAHQLWFHPDDFEKKIKL